MSSKQKAPFFRKVLRTLGHFSILRFGIRDRIIRFFHNPDLAIDEEFIVDFYGLKYRGKFNTFIDWSVYYYGAYSKTELVLISDLVRFMPKPRFMDVGANIGHHTLFASSLFEEVISLEPYSEVYQKIEEKIRDNDLENVRLFRYGFGDANGAAVYTPPDTTNTGTGSFTHMNTERKGLTLQIIKADDFVKSEHLLPVSLIKIDTEGYEPFVLKGMNAILHEQRPVIFFEWTQEEHRHFSANAKQNLFPSGYFFYQLLEPPTVMFIFQLSGYRLTKIDSHWRDGMVLAIPEEYLNIKSFQTYLNNRIG